jgi:hypothetical protein
MQPTGTALGTIDFGDPPTTDSSSRSCASDSSGASDSARLVPTIQIDLRLSSSAALAYDSPMPTIKRVNGEKACSGRPDFTL